MTSPEAKGAARAWTLLDVLPQQPPMVLLDEIVAHDGDSTSCAVRIGPASPFASEEGSVPCWIALEYMAQCAAAHSGIKERDQGHPIRLGFLLGSRRVAFHVQSFGPGAALLVTARVAWDDGELASFECAVKDRATGALLAECELSAYSPHDLQDLMEKQKA